MGKRAQAIELQLSELRTQLQQAHAAGQDAIRSHGENPETGQLDKATSACYRKVVDLRQRIEAHELALQDAHGADYTDEMDAWRETITHRIASCRSLSADNRAQLAREIDQLRTALGKKIVQYRKLNTEIITLAKSCAGNIPTMMPVHRNDLLGAIANAADAMGTDFYNVMTGRNFDSSITQVAIDADCRLDVRLRDLENRGL